MEVTLNKIGAWAGSVIAILALSAMVITGLTWKIHADDVHEDVKSIKELTIILGNKEEIREQRSKIAAEKEAAADEAELELIKKLCDKKKLDKDSPECKGVE